MWAGGNFGMAQTLFSNVECWLTHMALDPETGLDVEGIHLRAATGLEAVDYFLPGPGTPPPLPHCRPSILTGRRTAGALLP